MRPKQAHGWYGTSEYKIFGSMFQRCYNPNNTKYHLYGGRGIKIADEWHGNFLAFIEHVGPRPSKDHSIDRIDNDGDYAPGNVRWATRSEQRRNQRPLVPATHCKHGHLFTVETTGFDKRGRRRCLVCATTPKEPVALPDQEACPAGLHPWSADSARWSGLGWRCRPCESEKARSRRSKGESKGSKAPCSVCGRSYVVRRDGTVRQHTTDSDAPGAPWSSRCPGSGELPWRPVERNET